MKQYFRTVQSVLDSRWGNFQYAGIPAAQKTDRVLQSSKLEDCIYRDLSKDDENLEAIQRETVPKLHSFPALSRDIFQSFYSLFPKRTDTDKVDTFETFIEQLSDMNQNDNALSVNSFYIIDDAKQRDKMTEEFYSAVKKEIALYQEKADYLIQSGSRSPSVMERWVNKIATLEQKKQHYEEILRRELDGLDDEFVTLRLLSQVLSVRANGLRFRKAA